MVVRPGENVTLQCSDVNKDPGHIAWFKQINRSEPLCITSMYSSDTNQVKYHNGFQPRRVEMRYYNTSSFLRIREVDFSDFGFYFCGKMDVVMTFTNMTFLKVKVNDDAVNYPSRPCADGDKDGTLSVFPLVIVLGVVAAVLLLVILILLLHISRRGRDSGSSSQQQQDKQVQDCDNLNYASLNFTTKRNKGRRTRERELETQVVYAATR